MTKTFVISLGGSLVSPDAGRVDIAFLRKFRALILKYVKKGNRFAIIVGGGKVCRAWQEAARTLGVKSSVDLDWIGIRATQLNAELVRATFAGVAHREVIWNPHQHIGKFKIVIGAGFIPGHSTDYDAVVRAKSVNATVVVNLSDMTYVYDKDPRKFKNAKPLHALSWNKYLDMIGTRRTPGMNAPFDPVASKTARAAGIRVVFMDGRDLKNVEKFLQVKKFDGTIIE